MELAQISLTAEDFDQAFMASLRRYGFAALIHHQLDDDRVQRIYEAWRVFFGSGVASSYAMDPEAQDGYFSPEQAESARGFSQRDYKEYFQYYPWGRCPDFLQSDLDAHFEAAVALGSRLLRSIAGQLPATITAQLTEPLCAMIEQSGQSMLRVLHYPAFPAGDPPLRAAPHEDINLLTLLPSADGPGLELQLRSGEWISVPNRAGQLIVNVGDMLQEATAGYLPSTTHRVAVSDPSQPSLSRMALPMFLHPRPEVVLSARYTAGEYLSQRLDELRLK